MITLLKKTTLDLYHMLYPNNCIICENNLQHDERDFCFSCVDELPFTHFEQEADNPIMKQFWGRIDVQSASSLLYLNKLNQVHDLIHQLKYKGKTAIGERFGRMMGQALCHERVVCKNFDCIIPVPLHWKKERKRGYNQADYIADGISQVLGIPWRNDLLKREIESPSQTGKNRYDRWQNVEKIFSVEKESDLHGKHILIVDDVVTTGATLESCAAEILRLNNTRVSFMTIATARS